VSTIFWSWQSDLDPRVTRNVVREALEQAIETLHAGLDERHELTSDTKGVAGSPDIVATILAKIEVAGVFVGDVTPVATTRAGKAVANPNVLIELGYAKKAIGLERIVLVWNTAFDGAKPEALPFDLRSRRGPISFHLPEGAGKAELAAAREELKKIFITAVGACLATLPPPSLPAPPAWHPASPKTPALWFDPARPLLINEDGVPGEKSLAPGPIVYARVLPMRWSVPSGFGITRQAPLLGFTSGRSWGMTSGGAISYSGSIRVGGEPRQLTRAAIQFRDTGELWAVARLNAAEQFFADAVVQTLHDFLAKALPFLAEDGGTGPFAVRLGVTGLTGMTWASANHWGGEPQALEPEVEVDFTLKGNDEEERLHALERASGQIAAVFGLPAPDRSKLLEQLRTR